MEQQRLQFLENQNRQMSEVLSRVGVEHSPEFQQKIIAPLTQSWNEAARIVMEAGADPQQLAAAMSLQGRQQFEALDQLFAEMPESAKTEAHDALRTYRRYEEARQRAVANAPKTLENIRAHESQRQYHELQQQRGQMEQMFDRALTMLRDDAKVEVFQTTTEPEGKWWNDQHEQVVNQAAKHRYMSGGQLKVPLTIRTQGGAGWSPGAQHAQQLESWFVHIPGLKVVFASTPSDVRGLLWSSIYDDNPVVFFEHRTLYGLKEEVPDELEPIPLGKARTHRQGEDVTVIATGRLVHESLAAAAEAEKEGVSVEVVDPRTLQPLDEEALISSVKKTNRCVVAHEAVTRGGFGAEVAAVIQYGAFDWLDAPVERVGARFAPLPFAPVMEEFVVPHQGDVLAAIHRTVGRRSDGN
jgi:pyruvate dehydrogenase E1 component beta subunit